MTEYGIAEKCCPRMIKKLFVIYLKRYAIQNVIILGMYADEDTANIRYRDFKNKYKQDMFVALYMDIVETDIDI